MRMFSCALVLKGCPAVKVNGYNAIRRTLAKKMFLLKEDISFKAASTSLSCPIFPLTPGLSNPQVGSWHQSSERSDGGHEGSGGGGGQRWQHRPGTPEGSGESSPGSTQDILTLVTQHYRAMYSHVYSSS